MRNSKQTLLLIILSVVFCSVVSQLTASDKAVRSSGQMLDFMTLTGFIGDFIAVVDGRMFSRMEGKFNLPFPADSLMLTSNMDSIAETLNAMYQKNGASFTLRRVSYNAQYRSCQYLQFWKSFYLGISRTFC